jgi:3-deoxy-7-phosphoheptulonate synthase
LEIENFNDWKSHFYKAEISELTNYKEIEEKINSFLKSKDISTSHVGELSKIYISHEGLLLDYEAAFTRLDTVKGGVFNTSAHTLWIGERTRGLANAHVEYFRGIENPIGIKVGPNFDSVEICEVIRKLNPKNEANRIMLIGRFGVKNVKTEFQRLIECVSKENLNVLWMSDPMHGNTFQNGQYKIRSFDDIMSEFELFVDLCNSNSVFPAGIHLELTGDHVSECIGGVTGLGFSDVKHFYRSKVDPRLNAVQAIELSFKLSELLNKYSL